MTTGVEDLVAVYGAGGKEISNGLYPQADKLWADIK